MPGYHACALSYLCQPDQFVRKRGELRVLQVPPVRIRFQSTQVLSRIIRILFDGYAHLQQKNMHSVLSRMHAMKGCFFMQHKQKEQRGSKQLKKVEKMIITKTQDRKRKRKPTHHKGRHESFVKLRCYVHGLVSSRLRQKVTAEAHRCGFSCCGTHAFYELGNSGGE